MKPTEARVKEFWERCGLKHQEDETTFTVWRDSKGDLICCGHDDRMPDLTLDNLFRYAVPKLLEVKAKFEVMGLLKDWVEGVIIYDKDPALALWEVINESL